MVAIDVQCDGSRDEGWLCTVALREGDTEVSSHRVRCVGGGPRPPRARK